MKKTVNEKVQEQTFARLLAQADNAECADCNSKGPCWADLSFGVFICFNCSGKLLLTQVNTGTWACTSRECAAASSTTGRRRT